MANRAIALSVGMSGLGLVAVALIFGLYATGYRELPWWLNGTTVLMPLGLATGVVSIIVQARSR